MNRAAIFCLLLAACDQTDPCAPLTVEVRGLSAAQHEQVTEAIDNWNAHVGLTVLAEAAHGDLVVSGTTPPHGAYAALENGVLYVGGHVDALVYTIEYHLGLELGVLPDKLPMSIMNGGPSPNIYILPEHVAQVRDGLAPECLGKGDV